MDKIELNNDINNSPITTLGELKQILEPFISSCEINAIRVFYRPKTGDIKGPAKLEITLA